MLSFCIKDNNSEVLDYLIEEISKVDSDDFIFIKKNFSKYNNLIIHYVGNNNLIFYDILTDLICDCILQIYEPIIVRASIMTEYFYFDISDMKNIENNCFELLNLQNNKKNIFCKDYSDDKNFYDRKQVLWAQVLKYVTSHKSIVLDGFVRFRISDYRKYVDEAIDNSVNKFVIDREYEDFINLINIYIESNPSNSNIVYLIYKNGESILLDENKNKINCKDFNLNSNYLSDISFSSNDYTLNSLLSLLPSNLIIDLQSPEDEFITTLKLIFKDRVNIKNAYFV